LIQLFHSADLQAAPQLQYFSKGAAAGARLFNVITRQPAIDPDSAGEEPSQVSGSLRLEGVTFAYPARPEVQVLKKLDLEVPAGADLADAAKVDSRRGGDLLAGINSLCSRTTRQQVAVQY